MKERSRRAPPAPPTAFRTALAVIALAVALGGCGGSSDDDGEPATGADDGTVPPSAADGGANAPGEGEPPGPDGAPGSGGTDPGASNVDGGPSDCGGAVPCGWASADGSLSLTLSAAEGERADGGGDLRVDFALTTTRTGELELLTASSVTAAGETFTAASATLGEESSGFSDRVTTSVTPLGEGDRPLAGSVELFTALPGTVSTIERVTLELILDGRSLRAVFAAVPVGDTTPNLVDCALALPCRWSADAGEVEVTITALGTRELDGERQLTLDYRLVATRPLTLASEGYTRVLVGPNLTLGQAVLVLGEEMTRFGVPLLASLEADERLDAAVGFGAPPPPGDASAARLELNLFEVQLPRVPRWNPVFTDLPLGGTETPKRD